ncbi:hypothetical protein ACHAWO_006268 [Cyclotella atomus]|uniref:Glycoside hydrolase family 125 protein n=1 Tax=Cyclotella atomus TaxID=382360 RepID=A0ABD3PWU1_9STRA
MDAATVPNSRRTLKQNGSRYQICIGSLIGIWSITSIYLLALLDPGINILHHPHLKGSITSRQNRKPPSKLPRYPIDHRGALHLSSNSTSNNKTLSDEAISQCHKALWHTLETTTHVLPNDETFVMTGDIHDMWLRDSAAQIHPLLIPNVYQGKSLVQLDTKLERVVSGLILKTARLIRHDPYANAFKIHNNTVHSKWEQEALGRMGYIATRNYELDSGCYFMMMLYFFYQNFPTHTVLLRREVREAVTIMIDLWIAEQKHELDAYPTGELFDCLQCNRPYRYNPRELKNNGKGTKTNATAGLTWSPFRPSDEPALYGYSIPSNMFVVSVLDYMMEMAASLWKQDNDSHDANEDTSSLQLLLQKAKKLKDEIQDGIDRYGIIHHETHGNMYAYEVDGFGNYFLEDDANIPSLLSIPYLGIKYDKQVYANTQRFIFSKDNPQYVTGHNEYNGDIEGIGSSHTHNLLPDDIWPMSLLMKGLVSDNVTEKIYLVHQLLKASAGTGWMHESFNANDPKRFTRSWFCWPDSLFAELVMSLTDDCPRPDVEGGRYSIMQWSDNITYAGSVFSAVG